MLFYWKQKAEEKLMTANDISLEEARITLDLIIEQVTLNREKWRKRVPCAFPPILFTYRRIAESTSDSVLVDEHNRLTQGI